MNDPLSFEHVARIDSTSSALLRRPFEAAPQPPRALMADVQEAGRGRGGRPWLSDPQCSLAVSVAVERQADAATLLGLPLAVGVAIAEVLSVHGARPRLKWPNDLMVETPAGLAKAGGILVEARQQGALQRVVVGFGLNLAPTATIGEAQVGQPVAALFDRSRLPARLPLARELALAVAVVVPAFARQGLGPWLGRWRALDALAGHRVELRAADGSLRVATAQGIDDDGALRVHFDDGSRERIVSGEVGVRRRD